MPPSVGQICRTPFEETSCLVKVIEIESNHPVVPKQTAKILYLEDSPHGYKKHTLGLYFWDELKPARVEDYCDHPCDEYFDDGSCKCTKLWIEDTEC